MNLYAQAASHKIQQEELLEAPLWPQVGVELMDWLQEQCGDCTPVFVAHEARWVPDRFNVGRGGDRGVGGFHVKGLCLDVHVWSFQGGLTQQEELLSL